MQKDARLAKALDEQGYVPDASMDIDQNDYLICTRPKINEQCSHGSV